MKKAILVLASVLVFVSCKQNTNDTQEKVVTADGPEKTAKQSDGLTLLKGDFLYFDDAAILQTNNSVYAVVIDKKMHELNDRLKDYKKENTDMIPVEIRGKISPKPEGKDGWPFVIEIKEILNVSAPKSESNDVIKLGN